jgi:hypothetical protein
MHGQTATRRNDELRVPADCHRADNAGENRRAKRLQEQICTQPVQGAAHNGAGARADKYQ